MAQVNKQEMSQQVRHDNPLSFFGSKRLRLSLSRIALFFSLAALPSLAHAAPHELPWRKQKAERTAEAPEHIIRRVEDYLNQLQTMTANFTQVASDGTVSEGKFYLSRPGKLRWEYFPPVRVTIVANAGLISYYDAELDQISHSSVGSTPLVFLTDKHVKLTGGEIAIKDISYTKSQIQLTLTQTSKEDEGTVQLTFTDSPLELRKMAVLNPVGDRTEVTFSDSVFTQSLDKDLFIIKDPRLTRKRKN